MFCQSRWNMAIYEQECTLFDMILIPGVNKMGAHVQDLSFLPYGTNKIWLIGYWLDIPLLKKIDCYFLKLVTAHPTLLLIQ